MSVEFVIAGGVLVVALLAIVALLVVALLRTNRQYREMLAHAHSLLAAEALATNDYTRNRMAYSIAQTVQGVPAGTLPVREPRRPAPPETETDVPAPPRVRFRGNLGAKLGNSPPQEGKATG